MYKIIACDMDETLLNSEHQISAKDIESIKKLAAMGVKFVIATGRGYNSVHEDLKKLDLYDRENEYVISFNGAIVSENRNDRIISITSLGNEKARILYDIGLEYNLCIHVYTREVVYVYNYLEEERKYIEGRMNIVEYFEKNLDTIDGEIIVKVLFMDMDMDKLHQVEKAVRKRVNDISISYSSNRYIEFNAPGLDKGYGLRKLAELLNVDLKDTIAVGDNVNDVSMIRCAGMGIGVRNSNPEILPDCDLVLPEEAP